METGRESPLRGAKAAAFEEGRARPAAVKCWGAHLPLELSPPSAHPTTPCRPLPRMKPAGSVNDVAVDALDLDRMKQVSVCVQRGCAGARAGGFWRLQGWQAQEGPKQAGSHMQPQCPCPVFTRKGLWALPACLWVGPLWLHPAISEASQGVPSCLTHTVPRWWGC